VLHVEGGQACKVRRTLGGLQREHSEALHARAKGEQGGRPLMRWSCITCSCRYRGGREQGERGVRLLMR